MISQITGTPTTISKGSVNDACSVRYCNGTKARRLLGYKPSVGIDEGIRLSCEVSETIFTHNWRKKFMHWLSRNTSNDSSKKKTVGTGSIRGRSRLCHPFRNAQHLVFSCVLAEPCICATAIARCPNQSFTRAISLYILPIALPTSCKDGISQARLYHA